MHFFIGVTLPNQMLNAIIHGRNSNKKLTGGQLKACFQSANIPFNYFLKFCINNQKAKRTSSEKVIKKVIVCECQKDDGERECDRSIGKGSTKKMKKKIKKKKEIEREWNSHIALDSCNCSALYKDFLFLIREFKIVTTENSI